MFTTLYGAQMWTNQLVWSCCFFSEVNIAPLWKIYEMLINPEAFCWVVLNNPYVGYVSVEQMDFTKRVKHNTNTHIFRLLNGWLSNNMTLHRLVQNALLQIVFRRLLWKPQWYNVTDEKWQQVKQIYVCVTKREQTAGLLGDLSPTCHFCRVHILQITVPDL